MLWERAKIRIWEYGNMEPGREWVGNLKNIVRRALNRMRAGTINSQSFLSRLTKVSIFRRMKDYLKEYYLLLVPNTQCCVKLAKEN